MCGGLTHRSGHLGSRQGVLRRGDAVRQRLTRHLLSLSERDEPRLSVVQYGPTPQTPRRKRPQ